MVKAQYVKEIFAEVIADDPEKTIRDCWEAFACWEASRNYGDAPSRPSRDALDWVEQLETCRVALGDFNGPAKVECEDAIDRAFEAFSEIEHSHELLEAVKLWRQWSDFASP